MVRKKTLRIALLGNPNSGKTSVFNHLTGMNQKVGNFPGVTVEKKTGYCRINDGLKVKIIDLPGTYSLYPRSMDERVVFKTLVNIASPDYPEIIIVVVDASNIKRNLLLFTQVKDLGIPVVLALNMLDVATNLGQRVSPTAIARELSVPVVSVNGRTSQGIDMLKKAIERIPVRSDENHTETLAFAPEIVKVMMKHFGMKNAYVAYLALQQYPHFPGFSEKDKLYVKQLIKKYAFNPELAQSKEIISRYKLIEKVIEKAVVFHLKENRNLTKRLDRIFANKILGYLTFFAIMFLMFQAIFSWANAPMNFIDLAFSKLGVYLKQTLPAGTFTSLLSEGIVPGIGGVVIFIPQIAILFAFISVLEESGYMSRVVFLMDRFMRKFGLNGRSVVPLISGVACAIPAIMATRTIENRKERLITILITPFMSCSARLPVYTILIALVVPETDVLGFLNLQGLVLMGMYLLGFTMALIGASIMRMFVKIRERSYLIMELPLYKIPRWKNVWITIYEKSRTFTLHAGSIILAISIVLWVMASYGPGDHVTNAEQYVLQKNHGDKLDEKAFQKQVESYKLEHSYAGVFGKLIEPVIQPLGYDWKIGIALITSFAAREVFVGTMATIYSIGSDQESTIRKRMGEEINPRTGGLMYTKAVAFSLLIFYAFAMQCMSTLAIVHRETRSWKWPLIQLIFMSGLAYVSSFIVYHLLK